MKKILLISTLILLPSTAQAVTLGEIIRNCRADGKAYCAKVGYGNAMSACLNQNYKKLGKNCQGVMRRLNSGEKMTFF